MGISCRYSDRRCKTTLRAKAQAKAQAAVVPSELPSHSLSLQPGPSSGDGRPVARTRKLVPRDRTLVSPPPRHVHSAHRRSVAVFCIKLRRRSARFSHTFARRLHVRSPARAHTAAAARLRVPSAGILEHVGPFQYRVRFSGVRARRRRLPVKYGNRSVTVAKRQCGLLCSRQCIRFVSKFRSFYIPSGHILFLYPSYADKKKRKPISRS